MTQNRIAQTARTLARLMAAVLISAFGTQATTSPESTVGGALGFAYAPSEEIVVVGTVKAFRSQPPLGGPAGLYLMVSSVGELVDVHLGPYISQENHQALSTGELVQIVGVNENVHGKNVLLARQLIFHGRLMTVRNERGFLVRSLVSRRQIRDGKSTMNGGIQ